MAIQLFAHNIEAYNAAATMLADCGKAAVIHPTGTGKSFIGFKFAEDNPNKHIVWLTPSDYIVKTQMENLSEASDTELANITFITYAKLMLMSAAEISGLCADMIICDEFHRCGAQYWSRGVNALIGAYPNAKILGLSATNIRYLDNQRNMADELFDGNIASEMTLGEAIVRGILLPPKYVISVYGYQKALALYEERIDGIVNEGIREKNRAELDKLRKALEMADGLDTVFQKNMDNKAGKYIVFCSNKSHMKEMAAHSAEWFGGVDPDMRIYKVYSDDPTASKDFIAFKNDDSDHLRLLFCIDMLNEGIHVNDIDGVILFRPTVSPIIYKQQIGRALSVSKKHKPIIFDVVNNFDNLYSISTVQEEINLAVSSYLAHGDADKIKVDSFEIIDETCDCRRLFEQLEKSLASTWEIYFQAANEYYTAHGNLDVPKRYVTDNGLTLGMWLSTQRRVYAGKVPGNLTQLKIERLNSIGMVWENVKELEWQKAYNHAKTYFETYGDLDVKAQYVCDDGFKLGIWIANMRGAYSNNSTAVITTERVKMLDKIGMVWSKNNALWERNFAEAAKFYIEHGHLNVANNYIAESGVKLGAWIARLKKQKTGASKYGAKLTEEQVIRLDSIGMDWDDKYTAQWKTAYKAACEYYNVHGNIDIPVAYKTKSGIALGAWIRRQRTSTRLTEEQRKQLNRIGMIWDAEDTWEIRYKSAQKYYAEHGDLEVPPHYKAESVWLGKWVQVQRQLYNQGKLSTDKYNKLNAIGMRWLSADELKWEIGCNHALQYYTAYGNINVSPNYICEDGFALGMWIKSQQNKYRNNTLSDSQTAKLESLGIVWETAVDKWQQSYQYLYEYYQKYGDTMVAANYVTDDGYKLGTWVVNQRAKYNRGRMSAEHIKCLEEIGFVWKPVKANWKEQFECAKRYYEQHGRSAVPKTYVTEKGFKLNYWVNDQRKAYRKGKLDHEQRELLEQIGIV